MDQTQRVMRTYTVEIIDFPTSSDYKPDVIQVFRDKDGTDLAFRFISPLGAQVNYIGRKRTKFFR